MTIFSEQLKEYIEKKKETVYSLSKSCDISRANMYKIVQGTRRPANLNMVYVLADALGLSPYERKKLAEKYEISKMGEEVYEERNYVMEFIRQFKQEEQLSHIINKYSEDEKQTAGIKTIYGKNHFDSVVKNMLSREAKKPEGRIYLICQPEYEFLYKMMVIYCGNSNVKIQHIICMEGKENTEENTYNLENLIHVSVLMMASCQYEPYYYYDNVASHFHNLNLLPYMILTSSEVVQSSSDYEYAIYSESEHEIDIFKNMFQEFLLKTKQMLNIYDEQQGLKKWFHTNIVEGVLSNDLQGYNILKDYHAEAANNLKLIFSEYEQEAAESGIKGYLLNPQMFSIPKNFVMFTSTQRRILILFCKDDGTKCIMEFCEKSLENSFYQFFCNLEESSIIYERKQIGGAINQEGDCKIT